MKITRLPDDPELDPKRARERALEEVPRLPGEGTSVQAHLEYEVTLDAARLEDDAYCEDVEN